MLRRLTELVEGDCNGLIKSRGHEKDGNDRSYLQTGGFFLPPIAPNTELLGGGVKRATQTNGRRKNKKESLGGQNYDNRV